MTVKTVEAIGAADRQRAVASLTLAFSTDPVVRWAWPDQEQYLSYWPRFVDAFGGGAFDQGTAHGSKTSRPSRCGFPRVSNQTQRPSRD